MSLATEILIRVWFTYESPMLNLSNTILAYCLSFFSVNTRPRRVTANYVTYPCCMSPCCWKNGNASTMILWQSGGTCTRVSYRVGEILSS